MPRTIPKSLFSILYNYDYMFLSICNERFLSVEIPYVNKQPYVMAKAHVPQRENAVVVP